MKNMFLFSFLKITLERLKVLKLKLYGKGGW